MGVSVTVLSMRIRLPGSNRSSRALPFNLSLIRSHVGARIAEMTRCNTDFFGAMHIDSRATD